MELSERYRAVCRFAIVGNTGFGRKESRSNRGEKVNEGGVGYTVSRIEEMSSGPVYRAVAVY